MEFSFLPLIVASALIYNRLRALSPVLLDPGLQKGLFILFAAFDVSLILSLFKRFYFTKLLVIAICAAMAAFTVKADYVKLNTPVFSLAADGAAVTVLNICALYQWKKLLKTEINQKGTEE